jgi:hypothetical protein
MRTKLLSSKAWFEEAKGGALATSVPAAVRQHAS